MEQYYEEIMMEVKSGKIKGEDLEFAYSSFRKILDAAEDDIIIIRRMCSNLYSDAIESLLRKKQQEYDAIEELVTTIRRQLY